MFVRFEENANEKLRVPDIVENKWSPRRRFLSLIVSSILCWSAILFFVYLVVS
jgi:hypothetical protein